MRADHFSPDVRELIRLLVHHEVRFLLVGGEAVIFHGYPRFTGDVDLWFEQSADNAARLFAALREFWGGQVPGIDAAAELLEPRVVVQFGRPPNRVDFAGGIDGIEFAQAWSRRIEEPLVRADGTTTVLPIIGIADLLQNKRATGRHKDLDDVEHLEHVLEPPKDA